MPEGVQPFNPESDRPAEYMGNWVDSNVAEAEEAAIDGGGNNVERTVKVDYEAERLIHQSVLEAISDSLSSKFESLKIVQEPEGQFSYSMKLKDGREVLATFLRGRAGEGTLDLNLEVRQDLADEVTPVFQTIAQEIGAKYSILVNISIKEIPRD